MDWLKDCFRLQFRVLSFRATADELFNLGWKHLPFGLFWALLAGIGRAWDNQYAPALLRTGAPSVLYVFVLSFFLWLFIMPLKSAQWRISRVLAFVGLTALPGVLYAVPLEMMLPPDDAATGNEILLLIVASWRVALLTYFTALSKLSRWAAATAVCLPLSIIIIGLAVTDQLTKTFAVMGGFRYFIVENESLAKPYLEEQAKNPSFASGTYNKLETRGSKGKHIVYREWSHGGATNTVGPAPPGLREVTWDDPEYMPPTPVIAVARTLNIASMIAAPFFGIVYLVISLRNLIQAIKNRSKKPSTVASEESSSELDRSA